MLLLWTFKNRSTTNGHPASPDVTVLPPVSAHIRCRRFILLYSQRSALTPYLEIGGRLCEYTSAFVKATYSHRHFER
jgi:hypothetical protein